MKNLKLTLLFLTVINLIFCSNVRSQSALTEINLKGKVKSLKKTDFKVVNKFGKNTKDTLGVDYKNYDENGNIVKSIAYNRDGNVAWNSTFKYNDKRNLVEENVFYYGYLFIKKTYDYDDKGNMIEENNYNKEGILENKTIYNYDDKGNIIENNYYKSDGSLDKRCTYKYDENGNKIEIKAYTSDGSLDSITTYKYDDKGNVIEDKYTGSDGGLISKIAYEYSSYDKEGNWLKKTEINDNKPSFLYEREIEYY